MSTCKDCSRWDRYYRECEAATVERVDTIPNNDFAVYAEADDDQGLIVGLKTGPNFGCTKFQRKA